MMLQRLRVLAGLELTPTHHLDKLVSGIGGCVAMGLVMWVTHALVGPGAVLPVVSSIGASAVLLFAAPHGQLSQPWPLVMGHLMSAVIGVTCAHFVSDPLLAGGLAVGLAITAMYYARAIHPPGGATALTPALGGATLRGMGYGYVLMPVALNVAVILLVAIAFNYAFRWRRYPAALAPPAKPIGHRIDRADWEHALRQIPTMADVTEDELIELHALALQHARDERRS